MARSYALCPIAPAPRVRNKLTTLFALLLSGTLFTLILSSLVILHRSITTINFFFLPDEDRLPIETLVAW